MCVVDVDVEVEQWSAFHRLSLFYYFWTALPLILYSSALVHPVDSLVHIFNDGLPMVHLFSGCIRFEGEFVLIPLQLNLVSSAVPPGSLSLRQIVQVKISGRVLYGWFIVSHGARLQFLILLLLLPFSNLGLVSLFLYEQQVWVADFPILRNIKVNLVVLDEL
mgnify:FL=1